MALNSTFSYADFVQDFTFPARSLFYLLTPRETYFEKSEDVPDLSVNAFNVMMSFMFFEQIIFFAKHGRFTGRINDTVKFLAFTNFETRVKF
jgi:hypothetical protein